MTDQYSLQGYYVSLSGDYLAVGTLEGDVTPGPRYDSVNLITQVYKWDESTGWAQLGDEIEKNFYVDLLGLHGHSNLLRLKGIYLQSAPSHLLLSTNGMKHHRNGPRGR
mmetsp:Transcript_30301/g.60832  ORF Transcript_30301/g.60832 Transcript_30301/m.60832 type:complete len:109 (-) Transcript_30301:1116-1442(-)